MTNQNGSKQLVEALKEAQGDKTTVKFAEELGIPSSTLYTIYSGDRRPGRKTLSRIITNRPDLKPAVDIFLTSDFANANEVVADAKEPA